MFNILIVPAIPVADDIHNLLWEKKGWESNEEIRI